MAINTDENTVVTFLSAVTSSGTIAAQAFANWNGNNPATYTTTQGFAHRWHNDGSGHTLSNNGAPGTSGGTVTYAFNPADTFTTAQQQAYVAALTLWSDECNITFSLGSSATSADVLLSLSTSGGTSNSSAPQYYSTVNATTIPSELTPGSANGGQDSIQFDNSGSYGTLGSFSAQGGYGVSALVHEIGHMIGLGHSGPYNDGTSAQADPEQLNEYDSRQWSVMSYIQPSDGNAKYYSSYTYQNTYWVSTNNTNGTYYQVAPETPMPLDILAAQRLYGTPTKTALSGGQVFGFNCNISDAAKAFFDFTQNTNPVITLWDAGTGNTLDLSGFSTNSTVDLNPGAFSSADTLVNNIGIAFGTAIDSAIGGAGDDTFTVNTDADTIDGGSGSNTVIFSGSRGAYTITRTGTDTVTVTNAAAVTDTLTHVQMLTFADQSVAASSIACFVAGTLIRTPAGDRPVESLAAGDLVVTAAGRHRPVLWLGHRSYAARFVAANPGLAPIVFEPGSLGRDTAGEPLPRRALRVSPNHAMLLDGVLVPAEHLVHGPTIRRDSARADLRYVHLELQSHDVILAEGAPSETFLDDGSRGAFHNAASFAAAAAHADPAGRFCAPRITSGFALDAIRRRLAGHTAAAAA